MLVLQPDKQVSSHKCHINSATHHIHYALGDIWHIEHLHYNNAHTMLHCRKLAVGSSCPPAWHSAATLGKSREQLVGRTSGSMFLYPCSRMHSSHDQVSLQPLLGYNAVPNSMCNFHTSYSDAMQCLNTTNPIAAKVSCLAIYS